MFIFGLLCFFFCLSNLHTHITSLIEIPVNYNWFFFIFVFINILALIYLWYLVTNVLYPPTHSVRIYWRQMHIPQELFVSGKLLICRWMFFITNKIILHPLIDTWNNFTNNVIYYMFNRKLFQVFFFWAELVDFIYYFW